MAEGSATSTGQASGAPQGSAGQTSGTEGKNASFQSSERSVKEGVSANENKSAPEQKTEKAQPEIGAEKESPEKKPEMPKHKYADKLLKVYADRKFEKPEDFDAALDEYLSELEDYKERGTLANQKLIAAFESEPFVGDIIKDYVNGASFRAAIARHLSLEDLTPQDGEPDYEQWNENKKKREEFLANRKKMSEERAKNLEASREAISQFAEKHKLDEKARDEFLGKIDGMLEAVNSGKVTTEFLDLMHKAINFEKELEKAKEEAMIATKNQKIIAQREQPEKRGDGLPNLRKMVSEGDVVKREPHYIDKIVERAKSVKID